MLTSIVFACEDCGSNRFSILISPSEEVAFECDECRMDYNPAKVFEWLKAEMQDDKFLESRGTLG